MVCLLVGIGFSPYYTTSDGWNSLIFDPVIASAVKIKVKLNKEFSAGTFEWVVN